MWGRRGNIFHLSRFAERPAVMWVFPKSLMRGQSTKAAAPPVSAIPELLRPMAFAEAVELLRSVIETADVS